MQTCTICFEEVSLTTEAHIDGCDHTYCVGCIEKWVADVENSCPQCKAKVNKIITKDIAGKNVEKEVGEKKQVYDPFENTSCQTCTERIEPQNLTGIR